MPTVDEENAAYRAVKDDIVQMEQSMPGMFVGYVEQYVTTARIVQMVKSALTAAEAVRNKPQKASSPR